MRRIVRNRAAEKAKLSGYGTPSPLPQDPGTALGRHPAYSINGILGIHQPDANANLHKRKRDEEGWLPTADISSRYTYSGFSGFTL